MTESARPTPVEPEAPSEYQKCEQTHAHGTTHWHPLRPRRLAVEPDGLPLDVALEAIEWARELLRQGYRDEHIVTFTEEGYGLEHPIRCRPNLIGCILNEWLATQMAPDREPGRYVMEWVDSGARYTALASTPSEAKP